VPVICNFSPESVVLPINVLFDAEIHIAALLALCTPINNLLAAVDWLTKQKSPATLPFIKLFAILARPILAVFSFVVPCTIV
jgi:hypothetical protein